jgi:N-acetyl-anhydromuramyl-L-alanine amidase AmpD
LLLHWSDIGYNEIINPDGSNEIGRGKMAIGAHLAGFNSISYGAMVGGVDASGRPDVNTLKDRQFPTLERRMRELSEEFPDIKWCGHRDLSPDKTTMA